VGSAPSSAEAEAWVARLLYPTINEAAFVLEDRIVERPSQIDAAMVLGTGFPPFRGGPLRYADTVGIRRIVEFLGSSGNARWKPCDLLVRLAEEGSSFHELERARVPAGAGA
jgi:3-hydroxyacyl-CoA dehydrogenase